MRTISKKEFNTDTFSSSIIELPFSSTIEAVDNIFKVDVYQGTPTIWYLCDSEKEVRKFELLCVETDQPLDDSEQKETYIGTIQVLDTYKTLHYFIRLVSEQELKSLSSLVGGIFESSDNVRSYAKERN